MHAIKNYFPAISEFRTLSSETKTIVILNRSHSRLCWPRSGTAVCWRHRPAHGEVTLPKKRNRSVCSSVEDTRDGPKRQNRFSDSFGMGHRFATRASNLFRGYFIFIYFLLGGASFARIGLVCQLLLLVNFMSRIWDVIQSKCFYCYCIIFVTFECVPGKGSWYFWLWEGGKDFAERLHSCGV